MKKVLKRVLSVSAFYLGIDALFYWLNRKAKRIITFHNVLPDELHSQGSIGVQESASEFREKVKVIASRFAISNDLNNPKSVTLTFDDGTLNEYEVAGEILREMNIPATLFVSGDIIDAEPENTLVTDKILVWCFFAPDEAVEKAFGVKVARDELWLKYVQPAYREDWRNRGRAFLSKLESVCPIGDLYSKLPREWVRLRMSGVTKENLKDLRKRGWDIGWHTWSHYPLGMLDSNAKRQELDSPKEYLDIVLSYPYGDIEAIGEESLKIAEDFGYPCAVSNDPYYSPHRGRFFLQRMAFWTTDKYEIHFELSGLKYFLQHRKLLPLIEEIAEI